MNPLTKQEIEQELKLKPTLTEQQFKDNFVKMLKDRLGAKAAPPDLPEFEKMDASRFPDEQGFRLVAANLLVEIQGNGTGSCTYQVFVNGQVRPFCIKNVTQAECNTLNGVFNPGNECFFKPWP